MTSAMSLAMFLTMSLAMFLTLISTVLLIVLTNHFFLWLIAILLVMQFVLLFCPRIMIMRILSLIVWSRSDSWSRCVIPFVPTFSTIFPFVPPVLTPVGRCIRPPATKVWWRIPIVHYRDS